MFTAIALAASALFAIAAYLTPASRWKRQLRAAKLYRLAEFPENTLGRVIGTVREHGETLLAPMSGRTCVVYVMRVEELLLGGSMVTLLDETRSVPFAIVDGAARGLIDARAASVAIDPDDSSTCGMPNGPDARQAAFLAQRGIAHETRLFQRTLWFHEAIIEAGDTIAVLGSGIREPDPEAAPVGDYRGMPPTLVRLTSSAKYPLVISDDPTTTAAATTTP